MRDKRKEAARRFADLWQDKGYEKGETHSFWLQLLREVYGVSEAEQYISFEKQAFIDRRSFIDASIPATRVLIEQKSRGKDLGEPIPQSDGSRLTPFQQARRYITSLPLSQHPRYVVTCNFQEFWVYDMERPNDPPHVVLLKDLPDEYSRLDFLVNEKSEMRTQEEEISVKAGELVGKLYDAFSPQYRDPGSPAALHSLNVLCVRLVFLLYAEDTALFGERDAFYHYLSSFPLNQMRTALVKLFRVLDTPCERRDPYLADDDPLLAKFPYVNGGLFTDESVEVPPFTEAIRDTLLQEASLGFDWSKISPTIFGAVFESTLNPETRRIGGMHYTSVENIGKVIEPLFMADLRQELEAAKAIPSQRERDRALRLFQDKLASLTFLDPACGSGNFLTEAYLRLRKLENEVIRELFGGQSQIAWEGNSPIRVSLSQFHGIEINDFAVTVAQAALWIAECQMMGETETIVRTDLDFLPLSSKAGIVEGNALRTDWDSVVPRQSLSYIMGNPPFSGARVMGEEQKADVNLVFKGWKNIGNLDYVCCWYKKAADYMQGTSMRAALVSTNSVSQGDNVALLWKPLTDQGVHIDFAYRTFRWDSESSSKAHVHCVIIAFSLAPNPKPKVIYDGELMKEASNINGYLMDAPDFYVESRTSPLCNVPSIGIGNKPIDDGNYLFTPEEMQEFVSKEPASRQYFKPWYGSYEFINNKPRYCLWLGDCTPAELRSMPQCYERVKAVREFRLASKSPGTVKLADKPTRFHVENMPKGNYIVIPETSSENRRYTPMGFMSPNVLCSNAVRLIPNASLYHFGVLTSNVHMAWMRAVGGRLEMRYRYSKDIVYNNFPWPQPTPEQRDAIERTAQEILDARAQFPDSSLADLYDETAMSPALRLAHQRNDRAVMASYGWDKHSPEYSSESACVASLMSLYRSLASPSPRA